MNDKTQSREGAKRENDISLVIVDAAIEVHRTLGGPGLLECIYEEALCCEIRQRGLNVQRQVQFPVQYKGHRLEAFLRIDLLVDGIVVVECKAVREFHEVFLSQALTYLRLTGLKLGLVVNFGEVVVKNGIRRVVNGL